jgi:putative transposase
MPYWQHYCHLVWATKHREPLIDNEIERIFRQTITTVCEQHRAKALAVGIMPEHVHLAMSIPPSIAISEFVGLIKGKSSFKVNQTAHLDRLARFAWQAEYGLISFGARSLDSVIAYVNNQAQHHATNDLWPTFEILESRPPTART